MSTARQRLARSQRLMASFLDDPAVEAAVRSEPARVARESDVPEEEVARLAAIAPERVAAFRASRAHKDRVRQRARGG
jgi:hypothetical protein